MTRSLPDWLDYGDEADCVALNLDVFQAVLPDEPYQSDFGLLYSITFSEYEKTYSIKVFSEDPLWHWWYRIIDL